MAPAASQGIIAPSDYREPIEAKDRRREDRKPGPKPAETADAMTEVVVGLMGSLEATAIARRLKIDPRTVRGTIKAARASLAARAELYVELHAHAAAVAALAGDAKPAQWALERIAEEGERIIDPPQAEQPVAPTTFNIGFKIGGLPEMTAQPVLTGEVKQ
jgi:hypothetical protein